MPNKGRLFSRITKKDLEHLQVLALQEHEHFFKRNPHLKLPFYKNLISICFCQGAASHFLNPTIGIKDFDIWHFYEEADGYQFPYRAHRRIENGYLEKPIDFLKRAIPQQIIKSFSTNPGKAIIKYLLQRNTSTKRFLLRKAVIGLYPNQIFGNILWEGDCESNDL